jgi:hypothetical protein
VAELRKLSEHCEFNDLQEMLRDRIVCGVKDTRIQKKLLAEPALTFKQAYDTAMAMELAEKNAQDLHNTKPNQKIQATHGISQHHQQTRQLGNPTCYRCGGTKHSAAECRFKDVDCRQCGKRGHLARACRSKSLQIKSKPTRKGNSQATRRKPTHMVREESDEEEMEEYNMYNVNDNKAKSSYMATPIVNGVEMKMEIDTGAALSVISEKTYKRLWKKKDTPQLQPTSAKLITYTGENIKVLGKINVTIEMNEQTASLPLIVVQGDGPSLLGKNWLQKLKLDWGYIMNITIQKEVDELIRKYGNSFTDELGTIQGVSAKIHLKPDAQAKFCRARSVAFTLRKGVEKELERLEKLGVIEQIQQSEWATPIVPVAKPNGDVRICGDFKVTLNSRIRIDSYPLPRIDDLWGTLAGGETFSKLDLTHAYHQIQLEDSSKPLTTITTHKGLYRFNRLPYGIASAPAIFQRTMESLLQNIPQVVVYIDDILITGKTNKEHLENLEEVLRRLEQAGARLKRDKCHIMMPSVEFLGHIISKEGIQPSKKNVEAIMNAPPPTNVSKLKSFLGMVTYYLKFVPKLSNTCISSPLFIVAKECKLDVGERTTNSI